MSDDEASLVTRFCGDLDVGGYYERAIGGVDGTERALVS